MPGEHGVGAGQRADRELSRPARPGQGAERSLAQIDGREITHGQRQLGGAGRGAALRGVGAALEQEPPVVSGEERIRYFQDDLPGDAVAAGRQRRPHVKQPQPKERA
jgi:hypothetical protein